MNAFKANTIIFQKTILTLGLLIVFAFFSANVSAQNSKGDKPIRNDRETRFKTPKKGDRVNRSKTYSRKRIQPRDPSVARGRHNVSPRNPSGKERAGRPVRPLFGKSKPKNKQRAWQGDLTGRRLRTKNYATPRQDVYPQSGRYMRKNISDQSRSGGRSINKVPVRSRTGKTGNIFPQRGRYVNRSPVRPEPRAVSNRATLARLNRLQGDPDPSRPGRKKKVVPRSASRSYRSNKSINVFARFPRPKKRGERAITTDIAGKPIRGKNFETPRPGVIAPTFKPYYHRRKMGDKPYKGPSGTYRTATRPGERAWTGDIAKRRIRHRDRSSKRSVEGTPVLSGGYRTATRPGETRPGLSALPQRAPGEGTNRLRRYQNRLKGKRISGGGGSISGRRWNNQGQPIEVRTPKQGGREALFQGNIKRTRPQKGGGSVSGKLWNNNGKPIEGRVPVNGIRAATFQGNIKTKRPEKGGGSVSGKLWNNNGKPIEGRVPVNGMRAATFQGNIKTKRPEKGGGSVSGTLWNNKETPIPVRTPPARARKEGRYPGNIKMFELQPGFIDQGEEFTGNIKLRKFRKHYVQNDKASEASLKKRRVDKGAFEAEGLQVRVKRRDYVKHKNSSEEALLKLEPTGTTKKVEGLQVRIQRRAYVKNPNASEDALMKLKPTKTTKQVSGLQVRVKQYHYKRNPSSAEDALMVREPGKAFARVTDYQGNIKMQKFRFFEKNRALHPDAQFVKINKNNVAGERDMMTNLKLWWARLFKKEEAQPEHLKEKGHKPRYDKGEQGMWYD